MRKCQDCNTKMGNDWYSYNCVDCKLHLICGACKREKHLHPGEEKMRVVKKSGKEE